MTPDDTFNELTNFVDLLMRSSVALNMNAVTNRRFRNSGIRRITWAKGSAIGDALLDREDGSISQYCHWLSSRDYSAVLFDGSLIQLTYDFLADVLVRHRLLYFPCPFQLRLDLLDDVSLVDLVEQYVDSGIEGIRLRAPVRFDYERDTANDDHPHSHFTFQWSHCRIPVVCPLSLGHFVEFVFKNFYPSEWGRYSFLKNWPVYDFEPTIGIAESQLLHFSYIPRNR